MMITHGSYKIKIVVLGISHDQEHEIRDKIQDILEADNWGPGIARYPEKPIYGKPRGQHNEIDLSLYFTDYEEYKKVKHIFKSYNILRREVDDTYVP